MVDAQLEGTWFLGFEPCCLVLNSVDTEVCNVDTSIDQLLIEILFSHPIGILKIYDYYYPCACLQCLLMDYDI